MHVDLVGQPWHSKFSNQYLYNPVIYPSLVTDLLDEYFKSDGLRHPVYGATFSSEYAWSHASEGKVNEEIRFNGELQDTQYTPIISIKS